jgi:2-polyprenyl-3-methyl-5-hydroxy-6-metoxy-1,4-benzoquinol methylase
MAKKRLENPEITKRIFELINGDNWPNATDPAQICDESSEEDKKERAQGIIEVCVNKNLKDLVVLDYGCGEGHVAFEAAQQGASLAVGYDIQSTDTSVIPFEERRDTLLLTTDMGRVKVNSYDAIILYDVLDHTDSPVEVLKICKSLLRDDGEIYVRTHPFCSRHGGHAYKTLNKAFVHLVLTDEELLENYEITLPEGQRVFFPLKSYGEFFQEAELEIKEKNVIKEPVEDFFKNKPAIKSRIMQKFQVQELPEFQMSISFIDYVLGK